MELYLIRHGQTEWNKSGKLQGKVDVPLNEYGRNAAAELGESLDDVSFDIIYSSPLVRAYETACLIRGRRNIQILRCNELTELDFGEEEGTVCDEWLNPDSKYNCFFSSPGDYVPPPGGESLEHCIIRTERFVRDVLEANYGTYERVMIVAHGALNKGIMCYLEGNDKSHFWGSGLQKNCSADVFSFDGNSWARVK